MDIFSSSDGLLMWMLLFVLKGLRRICEHIIRLLELAINTCSDRQDDKDTFRIHVFTKGNRAREKSPRTNLLTESSSASENLKPCRIRKSSPKQHIQDQDLEKSSDFVEDEHPSKEEKKTLAKLDPNNTEEGSKHFNKEEHEGTDYKSPNDREIQEHRKDMFGCDQVDSNSAYYKETLHHRLEDIPGDEFLCESFPEKTNDKDCQKVGFSDENASLFTTKAEMQRKQIQHMHENLSQSDINFDKNTSLCNTDLEDKTCTEFRMLIMWVWLLYINWSQIIFETETEVLCPTDSEKGNANDTEYQTFEFIHCDTSSEIENDHFQPMQECTVDSVVTSDENASVCQIVSKGEDKDVTECQRYGFTHDGRVSFTTETAVETEKKHPIYDPYPSNVNTNANLTPSLTDKNVGYEDDIDCKRVELSYEKTSPDIASAEIKTNQSNPIQTELSKTKVCLAENAVLCLTCPKNENRDGTECEMVEIPHDNTSSLTTTEIEADQMNPVQYSLPKSKYCTFKNVVLCQPNPVKVNGENGEISQGDPQTNTVTEIKIDKIRTMPEDLLESKWSATNAKLCFENAKERNDNSAVCKRADFPCDAAYPIRGNKEETEGNPLVTLCSNLKKDKSEEIFKTKTQKYDNDLQEICDLKVKGDVAVEKIEDTTSGDKQSYF